MKSEETTIQPGAQFKYLGGIFTIGAMYEDVDTFYFKDQNEEIFEGKISTLKRMVRDGMYHMVKAPAIGGEAVPCTSEAPGPQASPKDYESAICVEELEKEGWEKFLGPYTHQYTKGEIAVEFGKGEIEIWVDDTKAKNCKTMPDLRTLELLVNGPQK